MFSSLPEVTANGDASRFQLLPEGFFDRFSSYRLVSGLPSKRCLGYVRTSTQR